MRVTERSVPSFLRSPRSVVAVAALGWVLLGAPLPCAIAADAAAPMVRDAQRKLRTKDTAGALRLLEQAIAADPADPDAHMLYQDVGRDVLGAESILTTYRRRAAEKPDDALSAYLYARLLPRDEAAKEYDKQLLKFPKSPWPHVGKARVLAAAGRHAEAAAAHDGAILLAGGDTRFHGYHAWALERAAQWGPAADAWQRVVAAKPQDRAARLGFAECKRRAGYLADALVELDALAQQDGMDAEVRYRIGLVHADASRYDDALAAFDGALKIDKDLVPALCAASKAAMDRARAKAKAEKRELADTDLDPALAYAQRAAAADPEAPETHFVLGAVHEAAGETNVDRHEKALVEYDLSLERLPLPTPEKANVLVAKAFVLLRLARWDEVIAAADKAIAIDVKAGAAYAHAGDALVGKGAADEAVKKYYRPGLKASPDNARLHHALGLVLWGQGKEQDAKKELEAAVKLEPKSGRWHLSLGELYYLLGEFKKAGTELFEATELMQDDPVAWSAYGCACTSLKDYEQAAEAFEKVVAILEAGGTDKPHPSGLDSIDEHLYLAILYAERLKDVEKAKVHARKFREMGGTDQNLESWITSLLESK